MAIINAENSILGRLATKVAKRALLGETINIINSESAIISGTPKMVLAKYKNMAEKGTPAKGPFQPRMADRFVRRTIKRMLPYKNPKGKDAYQRIMCYIGTPEEFKNKQTESVQEADIKRLQTLNFVTVKEICKFLKQ